MSEAAPYACPNCGAAMETVLTPSPRHRSLTAPHTVRSVPFQAPPLSVAEPPYWRRVIARGTFSTGGPHRRGLMPSIDRYVKVTGAFDPEAIRVLGRAYDLACALVGHTAQPVAVREAIAKGISKRRSKGNAICVASEM